MFEHTHEIVQEVLCALKPHLERIEETQKEILKMSASNNSVIAALQGAFAKFQTDFAQYQTDQSAANAAQVVFQTQVKAFIASVQTPGSGTTLSTDDAAALQGITTALTAADTATQAADASALQVSASIAAIQIPAEQPANPPVTS